MKNLLKEKAPPMQAVGFGDLHVGCRVGFGFMPQKNLSGRRMQVTQTNSYIFDGDSFLAHRLEDDATEVNLIVAGDGDAGMLALSVQLQERLHEPLFAGLPPQSWFALKPGHEITVAPQVLGAPRGWLAPRYTLAMTTSGRLLEGDYRMRRPEGRLSLSRPFAYALFVDFANDYALEAERYDDDTLHVYATVYRPQTDIGEMSRPARIEPPVVKHEAMTGPLLETPPEQSVETSPAPEVPRLRDEPAMKEPSSNDNRQIEPRMSSPMLPATLEDRTPVHGKFGRIPVAGAPYGMQADASAMLACDLKLAGCMIDEALRNRMPLAELIRKVIDLPVKSKDEVLIPFELEPAEYAELARRYDVAAGDHDGVRERIIQELKHFAGVKG